jgi:integrase
MKLTQRSIDTLVLPACKREAILFDDDLPGFGLRLRVGGSRIYVVQYKLGAKHRRLTLGSTALLRLEQARDKARQVLAKVRLGDDPATEKAEAKVRAGDICEAAIRRYLTRQRSRLRPRSYTASEHNLLVHWKSLHGLPVAKVDRRTIASRLSEIVDNSGPAAADRARATLSSFFTWAMKEGLLDASPVTATNQHYSDKGRERVLSEDELAEVWRAAGDNAYGTVVRILILTGQRRDEIGGLRWPEIDFTAQTIRLPAERVKNGCPHDVPLSDLAVQLLQAMPPLANPREYVFGTTATGFGGYSYSKRALDQRIAAARSEPMPLWTLHDLRRSVATHLGEKLGTPPHIVEAILNHRSGFRAGVAGVYNRAAYEKEKRVALSLWADRIVAAVEGRGTNVVLLRA